MSTPASNGVDADYRDFAPLWHLKAVALSAAVLGACLWPAWNLFLG
ncbi:MAG TPA: hypothetical protein VK914_04980 [bacterium]|nr:hypothetical protein [bacterium]